MQRAQHSQRETDYALIVAAIREVGGAVAPDAPGSTRLFEDLGLDSLMLMDAIELIQQKCGVVFQPEDYTPDAFATLHDIALLVKQRSPSIANPTTNPVGA